MKNKVIALLLSFIFVCFTFAGCKEKEVTDTQSSDTTADTPVVEEFNTVIENGKTEYTIVRSDFASKDEVKAVMDFRDKIKAVFGINMKIANDRDEIKTPMISVGKNMNPSTVEVFENLRYNDFCIAAKGKDIVICGGSPEKTQEALKFFVKTYMKGSPKSLVISTSLYDFHQYSYKADGATVFGEDLSKFTVIYSHSANKNVESGIRRLNQTFIDNFGRKLDVKKDARVAEDFNIIIGKALQTYPDSYIKELSKCGKDQGLIFFEGKTVFIGGNTSHAIADAINRFCRDYVENAAIDDGIINVPVKNLIVDEKAVEYSVMTFNVLYSNPLPRKDAVLTQIRERNPSILGIQECSVDWYSILCSALKNDYGVVGEINNPLGQKWRNPIFYKKDQFELISTKTQWLSSTPSSMSKLTASSQYRILTSAVLKDKKTGEIFEYFNTHMDYVEEAKTPQYNILLNLIQKSKYPSLITGDFNTKYGGTYHQRMEDGGFTDAFNLTEDHDPHGTYRSSGNVIDFCFVTADTVNVISHDVVEETVDGIDPSDHCAVVVKFKLFKH